MRRMTSHWTALFGCALVLAWWGQDRLQRVHGAEESEVRAGDARHFDARIAPLLARHCLECHGARSRKARLDVSRRDTALAGGNSGAALVPGNADESLLWQYVEADEMPPENRPRLSGEEKRLLREWIDAGAVWSGEAIGAPPFTDERIEKHREFDCDEDVRDPGPALLRRLTVPEYVETVRSAVGVEIEHEARRLLPPDMRADGFSNTAYNLNVDLANVEAYAELARIIVRRMNVAGFAAQFSPSRSLSDDALRELIAPMGKWLLRGPLDEREIAAYLSVARAVAGEGGRFDEAVGYVIEAILQSPRFLYLIEDQRGDGTPRRVSDYELASRMSYILWGGPPDRELMWAADAGALSSPEEVQAQVRRMLEDPRAVARSRQFIREWLNLDQLDNLRPNGERFPQWDQQLAADMREETLAFFEYVAWEQQRPLSDLMNAQVTFATPRLAEHYGLDPSHAVAGAPQPFRRLASGAASGSVSRITEGLQALYTFEEGEGDAVRDVSGLGEPLDLRIADPSAVDWTERGLRIRSGARIASAGPATKIVEAARSTGALTIEAWVTPANDAQDGPARIATLSADANLRNFTLGQDRDRLEVRLRTTQTSTNGVPALISPSGTAGSAPLHVAYVRDASGRALLYVDGRESARGEVAGDFSNWDAGFRFALGNELTGDRPWQGTLHLVAVYNRALRPDEVQRNHRSRDVSPPGTAAARVSDGLQVLYAFDEGEGDTIHDRSEAGDAFDLEIAEASAVRWGDEGLTVQSSTRILGDRPPARLIDAIRRSNAMTLEAWVTPADASQQGPARIFTLSDGVLARNFTVGQEGDRFDVRLRTTATCDSGTPSVSSASGAAGTARAHVVYTRDAAGNAIVYVDGRESRRGEVAGDLSNWDGGFRLGLANETSRDRPWRGTLHLAAVYDRALSADEVRRNHDAGARPHLPPRTSSPPSLATHRGYQGDAALQALYHFDEGAGDTIRDRSGVGGPLDLTIEDESAVAWEPGGLRVHGATLIATAGGPTRLIDAVKQSNAATLEAWITPADLDQAGPARILTLSSGIGARNFTLGQEGDRYDVRFRTTTTDANGIGRTITSPSGTVEPRPTHVVYTRSSTGTGTLYVNGEEQAGNAVDGTLSNWEDGFRLALANETSKDRPWRGTYHLVAVFSRALSPEEIRSRSQGLARYDLASVPARGGLLTQGSTLTAGGDEASMVARGLFVLHDILASGVDDPPPCVDTTPAPTGAGLSQRGLAEARLADSSCVGCHSRFEPLAFGLEKFDGIGAFHEVDEHGNTLRDDGEILFPREDEPVAYQTSAELMDILAGSERIRETITLKLTQFALGRPLVKTDACALAEIHKAGWEGGGTYASLITAVVMSDLVQWIRTEPDP